MEIRMKIGPLLKNKMARKGAALEGQIKRDVIFIVHTDKTTISAHARVLSFENDVFKAVFDPYTKDGPTRAYIVKNLESSIFLAVLKVLYSQKIDLSEADIMKVISAAQHFEVPDLRRECITHMLKNLNDETAFTTLERATILEEEKLQRWCLDYIDERATSIFISGYFLETDLQTLCRVLERDTLNIAEIELFRAVSRWAVAQCNKSKSPIDTVNRRKFSEEALRSIRFSLISALSFYNEVVPSSLLPDKDRLIWQTYYKYGSLPLGRYTTSERAEPFSTVMRFSGMEAGWAELPKTMAISFSVDRPIKLIGVCFFGPTRRCEFTISFDIEELKYPFRKIGTETLINYTDGSPRIFPITFRYHVVHIEANKPYKILTSIERPSNHIGMFYGINGRTEITETTREGIFEFRFMDPKDFDSETTMGKHQVPKLIFRAE